MRLEGTKQPAFKIIIEHDYLRDFYHNFDRSLSFIIKVITSSLDLDRNFGSAFATNF